MSHPANRAVHARSLRLEPLEDRTLLSATVEFHHMLYGGVSTGATNHQDNAGNSHYNDRALPGVRNGNRTDTPILPFVASPPSSAKTPQQIRTAYGLDAIVGDGTGQTIAIVDAYDDPNIAADLAAFNAQFGLPSCTFTKLNQYGVAGSYPTAAGTTGWSTEIALDVQWAHAIAPGASILLVEANSANFSDMLTAVTTAKNYAGVSVVSMSWGAAESDLGNMSSYDSYFTTPTGHNGVTFLASTGDDGGSGSWPSLSSNVVAVGGTSLTINSSTYAYVSESAWSSGNGGQSAYATEPSYQTSVQSSGYRQTPDVSFVADPYTGVAVYDSYGYSVGIPGMTSPWIQIGGTSLSAPCWAGLVAIADQLRVDQGLGTLDGRSQTLQVLYDLPTSDFHDITTGSNDGYLATAGYDMATGIGSPIAYLLAPALAGATTTTAYSTTMDTNPGWTFSGGTWAFGTPTGSGGDPSSGHSGTNVIGYNLSGAYASNINTTYWATSPAINCSSLSGVTLDFWRWLGVQGSTSDHAYIQVSNNGTSWTTVWQNPTTNVIDTVWSEQAYDISSVADNQATVYVRFGLGTTNGSRTYCGWNIDDVTVAGLTVVTPPTVSSLTPSTTTLADANAGTAAFSLSVVYSAAMNTSLAPTVSFPVENPGGTLTLNSAQSGWSNSTTYVARFDVADANVTLANVDVRVAGAKSAAGIAQTQADYANVFSIDTKNPTVTINQAAAQADPTTASTVNFTVVFSESVADFIASDVTLSGSAGATTAIATGGGNTYNVAVSGMTGPGTIVVNIAAGKAHDMAGNANVASTSTDNSVTYSPTLAAVQSVVVNDGNAQRSMVDSLTVTFNEAVTIDAGAFAVTKTDSSGAAVTVSVATQVASGKTVATLTFGGALVQYASLIDGVYLLTVEGSKVHDPGTGFNLDGDGNGLPGGNYLFGAQAADHFFRLYGDDNGDDVVDSVDLAAFRSAYLNAANYQWYFDFDSNGKIDAVDFFQFNQRYTG